MSVVPAPDDPWIGRVIDGRYKIVRRLGEGGMGLVFEAEHLRLGKHVALKIVLPELLGDPEVAARFAREAIATAQIEHPHIASGFDSGMLPEGSAYLVAQLVRGTSLAELVKQGPVPYGEACRIAAQISDALTAIHGGGWVHRDLTPENVVVSRRDDGAPHVYVLDFGVAASLAQQTERPADALTAIGTIVGTQGYMPPEQALGKTIDARADLYVVGVLLWEMIAGHELWASDETLTEVVSAQLKETPPAPPAPPDAAIPEKLETLIRELLSPEPEQRPSSAADVRRQLLDIVEAPVTIEVLEPAPPPERKSTPERKSKPEPPARASKPAVPPPPVPADAAKTIMSSSTEVQAVRDAVLEQGAKSRELAAVRARNARITVAVGGAIGLLVVGVVAVAIASMTTTPDPAASLTPVPLQAGTIVAPPMEIEPAVAEIIDDVMGGRNSRERNEAAERLLALSESRVPPFALAAARLELETTCAGRREHIVRLTELGDRRALPVIERMHDAPRDGCGRGRRFDCYGCVRDELDAAYDTLMIAPE